MNEAEKELHELKGKLWKEQELCKQEREVQHKQVQQGAQHVKTDETTPVQVVDSSEQLALGKQGEPSQEQDFAHEIEQALQQLDTDMEQRELEHDIDLMPHNQEIDLPASPHPDDEKVSNDRGGNEILGDQLEEEMHNISFDKSQHRVVQSCRVSTPNDHTSPVKVEERVIMSDM